ncbi:hypothetical protein CH338_19775, partial [Rhodoplanes elegans]
MRIVVVGCGEVGRCYVTALAEAGISVSDLCDAHPSQAARDLASRIGAPLHDAPGAWLAGADLVLSAVTGGQALAVARASFPFLRPGTVFADMTTASPDDIRAAAVAAQAAGVRFVDVAIMGGISLKRAETGLICAGDGAADLRDLLAAVKAPVTVLTGEAGDAVTLKLLRSIFMKGLEALTVETFVLARRLKLVDALHDNLKDFDAAPLRAFLEMLVRTHVLHAERRLHEVEEAEDQLLLAGVAPCVTPGVRALFARTADALHELPPAAEPAG